MVFTPDSLYILTSRLLARRIHSSSAWQLPRAPPGQSVSIESPSSPVASAFPTPPPKEEPTASIETAPLETPEQSKFYQGASPAAVPVSIAQAKRLNKLFTGNPRFVSSASGISEITKDLTASEVLFLGRSNVGKSSLLNALMGRRELVKTSRHAGHTKLLNFFSVSPDLTLVDAPGYGARGRDVWGKMIDEYLKKRQLLRRVFVLLHGKDAPLDSDLQFLAHLDAQRRATSGQGWDFQVVITKADLLPPSLLEARRTDMEMRVARAAPTSLPGVLLVGLGKEARGSDKLGVDEVRRAVAQALSGQKKKRS